MMRRTIWALGALMTLATPALADEPVPTFHREVVRVFQKHCQDCHRPGQVAPFSLLSYDHARKRAADIVRVTEDRRMPPWPADPNYGGPFRDQRVMTEAEIDTLRAWVEAGCPEGDNTDAPAPREFASDWPLGKPDLILTMEEAYELTAEGNDDFRVFVLKTDLPEDRYIRAVDFKPGNRTVVHHILAGVDTSGRARELDAADPKPGYYSISFGEGVPMRNFLPFWTPGSRPREAPEGTGYLLPKGGDVLLQIHYHKSGKVEKDASSIGLYFSDQLLTRKVDIGVVFPAFPLDKVFAALNKVKEDRKVGRSMDIDELMKSFMVIPAGEENYEIKGTSRNMFLGAPLSRDILVTAVVPHMHWLGKDFTMKAVLPDGGEIPMIKIDRWDFNWQGTYVLEEPVRVPKGAWFELVAHFDNTDANPVNPQKPARTVYWGNQTNDEMCLGAFEFISPEDGSARSRAR
jgi:hypothetical protein